MVESSEIPLLPVSNMKLRVSGKSENLACSITMPPVNCVKGMLVINLEGGSINSSWAFADDPGNREINRTKQ